MYLVDTNILIWLLRGLKNYLSWFERLKEESILAISTISIAEVYKNILPAELIKTEQLINDFEIIDVTVNIAKEGGLYWKQYIKKFKKLHILDCLIAASAKEQKLTLLTLNTRHFPMDDIKVIDPLK